jgi:DNA-directed RNA polymerase subunit RPC12/RpoP
LTHTDNPIAKLQCPSCQSRLDVAETPSGGKTISVSLLGSSVEEHAQALEIFLTPAAGPRVKCPACGMSFDPSEPYRAIPPLRRKPA